MYLLFRSQFWVEHAGGLVDYEPSVQDRDSCAELGSGKVEVLLNAIQFRLTIPQISASRTDWIENTYAMAVRSR